MSIKAAWNLVRSRGTPNFWHKFVWNKILPPSATTFAWRLFHNKTPISMWVKRIGAPIASACPLCLKNEESEYHILFECHQASQMWTWLCIQTDVPPLTSTAPSIWRALSADYCSYSRCLIGAVILMVTHAIWKVRNELFREKLHLFCRSAMLSLIKQDPCKSQETISQYIAVQAIQQPQLGTPNDILRLVLSLLCSFVSFFPLLFFSFDPFVSLFRGF